MHLKNNIDRPEILGRPIDERAMSVVAGQAYAPALLTRFN